MIEGFVAILSGAASVNSTLLRAIGRTKFYSLLMVCNQILLWDTLSIIFLFVCGYNGWACQYAM